MAGRYKGNFSSLDKKLYQVEIIKSGSSGESEEIVFALNEPFVVSYNTSETPFDPIRTSVATLNIISDDYLEDIYSDRAQETKIELKCISGGSSSNEIIWTGFLTPQLYDQGYANCYEEISLNAADCLSSLQYLDYELKSGDTKQIVSFKDIIDQVCNKCQNLTGYYWTRSKKKGNSLIFPEDLKISEYNFFSNDTDEPWKLNEVLEEVCKYIGMTCLQFKDRLYFIDYQYFHNNDRIYGTWYPKSGGYPRSATYYLDDVFQISRDTYRGSNNDITFCPIYNKAKVNDNMYEVEEFIPSIFEDKYLTNRISSGSFYTDYELLPESPDMAQKPHKVYKFVAVGVTYYDDGGKDSNYRYFHRLYDNKYWESVYHLASGAEGGPTDEEYKSSACTRNYMGGTIVDLGCIQKDYSEYYQRKMPSKMDFTRYLCLCNKYSASNNDYRTSIFPPTSPSYSGPFVMYKLKDGFKSPVIWGSNHYLVINFTQVWERYVNRAYINPKWGKSTIECSAANNGHYLGNMRFILKIGNKWWDGDNQMWQIGTPQPFTIDVEKTKEGNPDVWNSEVTTVNNVPWSLQLGCEGYKIPLTGVSMNSEIELSIIRPKPLFMYYEYGGNSKIYHYNAYCWVKDLSIKCVQEGQDTERQDTDIVYENIIDADAVNELNEISLKITTLSDLQKPSYSTVGYGTGNVITPLTTIKEDNLSGVEQKPEENIVEKYVNQYDSTTKKFSLDLDMTIKPFTKVKNVYLDEPEESYVVLGQDIDYAMGKQTIKLIQKK